MFLPRERSRSQATKSAQLKDKCAGVVLLSASVKVDSVTYTKVTEEY